MYEAESRDLSGPNQLPVLFFCRGTGIGKVLVLISLYSVYLGSYTEYLLDTCR